MTKKILLIIFTIIIVVVITTPTWDKPKSYLAEGEVRFQEVIIEDLDIKYQSLISNYYEKENGVYLIHSHGGEEPYPILVYSNLHKGENLYSYPIASVKREKDTVKIFIKDEDALNDDQTKDKLVLLIETQPPPAVIKIYYNNKVIQPQVRAYPLEKPILKSDK